MPTAYIVDAVRTAGGRRGGKLAGVHPVDLAAKSLDALVERTGVDPQAMESMNMGAYEAEQDRARQIAAIPPTTYATPADWLADLPPEDLQSESAAGVLLAVPRQTQGLREEMFVSDIDALLRGLILTPEFQIY